MGWDEAGVGGGVGMLLKQIPKYGQRLWDWGVSRGQKSSQVHGRTSLHLYEGIPGRKMDVKGNVDDGPERKQESWRDSLHHVKPGEVSGGKEEHVSGTGGKATHSAELCFSVLQKIELGSDGTGYLAEVISKQSLEGLVLVSPYHLQ